MTPGPSDPEPQWPPRSPHEALLSTPGGRHRYRNMLNSTSPSPSPRKGQSMSDRLAAAAEQDNEEEVDEETLQLKLQEIQARLRLKKLQAARSKSQGESSQVSDQTAGASPFGSPSAQRRPVRSTTPNADENIRPRASGNPIQVPASPVRKIQASQPQTSPSRVLLGIDKGLKARDVSLKRAPSHKRPQADDKGQHGGYLRSSRTPNLSSPVGDIKPSQSFNERLASVRSEEATRAERQRRIQKMRTTAFGIGQNEIDNLKKTAVEIPSEPLVAPSFSRDEILSNTRPSAQSLPRSNTAPNLNEAGRSAPGSSSQIVTETIGSGAKKKKESEEASFEPYSTFHLHKRILPHQALTRQVSGKKTFGLKDILKVVKAPDFSLPDIEQDVVVFAIVAKKSDPRAHKPTAGKNGLKSEDRGKYMVITLVDLDFELDLFLFNTGFTRFWKLTEGTVIAILNPNIMPPPPGRQATGKFSLMLNSDGDTVMEIGTARDLGFCKSVKRDGQLCMSWVNAKRTQFCEFHSNEAVSKQRQSRLEINDIGFGGGERRKRFKESFAKPKEMKDAGRNYDFDTKTHWFTSRSYSTADLIDGKDRAPIDTKEKAEFVKRGLEAKERERDMMKKLGQIGNAAGREYMLRAGSRVSDDSSQGPSNATLPDGTTRRDAQSLGLLTKDHAVHLSPVKRKRPDSSQAGSLAGSTSSLGWGGGLKDKLSRMKEGEKLRPSVNQGSDAPVRKKTRFVTEKGIREAGRESLGLDLSQGQVSLGDDDDEDDELVIVR